jgi:hAT family C-terminal dimerisation region
MVNNIKDVWRTEYGGDSEQPQTLLPPTDDILNQYLRRATAQNGDSFDSFIHGPVVEFNKGADVYSWLKDNYGSLIRRQALDLLSIPAMPAEVKRVFSSAKLLITPQRNSLSDERIKYLELLRY